MSKTTVYHRITLALVLMAVTSAVLLVQDGAVAYADDDEEEGVQDEESGSGFGIQERERDRDGFGLLGESEEGEEEDDDEREGSGFLGNNNVSSLVLGGTILAILGAGGYAGYKLLRIRQKKSAVVKGSKSQ